MAACSRKLKDSVSGDTRQSYLSCLDTSAIALNKCIIKKCHQLVSINEAVMFLPILRSLGSSCGCSASSATHNAINEV